MDTDKTEETSKVINGQYVSALDIISNFQLLLVVIISIYTFLSLGIYDLNEAYFSLANSSMPKFNSNGVVLSIVIFVQGIIFYMIVQAIKTTHQDVSDIKAWINDK